MRKSVHEFETEIEVGDRFFFVAGTLTYDPIVSEGDVEGHAEDVVITDVAEILEDGSTVPLIAKGRDAFMAAHGEKLKEEFRESYVSYCERLRDARQG